MKTNVCKSSIITRNFAYIIKESEKSTNTYTQEINTTKTSNSTMLDDKFTSQMYQPYASYSSLSNTIKKGTKIQPLYNGTPHTICDCAIKIAFDHNTNAQLNTKVEPKEKLFSPDTHDALGTLQLHPDRGQMKLPWNLILCTIPSLNSSLLSPLKLTFDGNNNCMTLVKDKASDTSASYVR